MQEMTEKECFHIPSGLLDGIASYVEDDVTWNDEEEEKMMSVSGVNPNAPEFTPKKQNGPFSTDSMEVRVSWSAETWTSQDCMHSKKLMSKMSTGSMLVHPMPDVMQATALTRKQTWHPGYSKRPTPYRVPQLLKSPVPGTKSTLATKSPKSPSKTRRMRRRELERNLALERERNVRDAAEAAIVAEMAMRESERFAELTALANQRHNEQTTCQHAIHILEGPTNDQSETLPSKEDTSTTVQPELPSPSKVQVHKNEQEMSIVLFQDDELKIPLNLLLLAIPLLLRCLIKLPFVLWLAAFLILVPSPAFNTFTLTTGFSHCAFVTASLSYVLPPTIIQGTRLFVFATAISGLKHSLSPLPHPIIIITLLLQLLIAFILGDTFYCHLIQFASGLYALAEARKHGIFNYMEFLSTFRACYSDIYDL